MNSINEINDKAIKSYMEDKQFDNWKLNYHLETNFGLINDPNGLSYFNNEYYIFFQWNPFGCEHKFKHWGLVRTKDFINYSIPKAVLAPDDWYDKNGCYSGSGIVIGDKLNLLYTGNVKDFQGNRSSYQCVATIDKEGNIVKKGPVLDTIPEGYTAHFRDPKVYKMGDKYYFVIGAQSEDLKGCALLYESADFEKWSLVGKINTKYEDFGFMWECPSLLNIDGTDVLVFSPQGLEKEEYRYQNIYQSGYILGKLDYNTLDFNHGSFEELDSGTDFYAPQVFKDDKNRNIMIGWMGLPEEENDHMTVEHGRVHCLTMPREIFIKDNLLYQKPVEEMKDLRQEVIAEEEGILCTEWKAENTNDNSYEINAEIDRVNSDHIELKFMGMDDEYSKLVLDFKNGTGILDNSSILNGPKSIRKFKIEKDEKVSINMFVDKSAVEIYLQGGRYVLSSRIYSKNNSQGITISSNEEIKINNLNLWSMGGFKYE